MEEAMSDSESDATSEEAGSLLLISEFSKLNPTYLIEFFRLLEEAFPERRNILAPKLSTICFALLDRDSHFKSLICKDEDGYIFNVATSPTYQGHGYASQLLKYICKESKKDIILDVHPENTKAYSLYCKMGFKPHNTNLFGETIMIF